MEQKKIYEHMYVSGDKHLDVTLVCDDGGRKNALFKKNNQSILEIYLKLPWLVDSDPNNSSMRGTTPHG